MKSLANAQMSVSLFSAAEPVSDVGSVHVGSVHVSLSSRVPGEQNEDSDDEVQSQCLAIEIENPEIDDIMREVFGNENMLL